MVKKKWGQVLNGARIIEKIRRCVIQDLPPFFVISWVGACCFLPAVAMGAAFSVSVDHTEIGHDHTFQLAARLDGSNDNFTLDVTSLEKSFYVTTERDTQQSGLWREKHYRLGAKRTGVLEVPALSIMFHGKKLVSQPFSVQVLGTDGEVDDVRLWVEDGVDHNHGWLRQQLVWHVTAFSTYPFTGTPDVHLPSFDGFDVQKVDSGVSGERVIKGRRLFIMTWRFLLFPKRSGDLRIAPPEVSVHVLRMVKTHRFAAGNPNFDAGEKREYSRKATGSEQHIRVRVLPLAAAKLPVGHLALSSDIPDTHTYAGEPLTWNIHLTGKGIRQSDMPDLWKRLLLEGAFSVVREKPLVFVRKDGHRISMEALYRIVLTPSTQGELRLPATSLSFFNPDHGRIEHALLDSRTLQVLSPRKASADEGFEISHVDTHRGHGRENSVVVWWKGLAIGMFVIWLVTVAAWFFFKRISMTVCLPSRRHRIRKHSLRRVLAARDAASQFVRMKDVLGVPERITPIGLLECFPDLRDGGGEITAWLEALERGCWQRGAMPPPLDGKHIRDMARIIQISLQGDAMASETFNPADFGRIGG